MCSCRYCTPILNRYWKYLTSATDFIQDVRTISWLYRQCAWSQTPRSWYSIGWTKLLPVTPLPLLFLSRVYLHMMKTRSVQIFRSFKIHICNFALNIVRCALLQHTVETLYSTIYYSQNFIELNIDKSTQYVALWTHKRHPIPRPFGRAMECLLWVLQQKLIVL